jgi:hypothetical protein
MFLNFFYLVLHRNPEIMFLFWLMILVASVWYTGLDSILSVGSAES